MEATLWEYHKVVYGVYDYYSSLMEERKDTHGELSIWAISYNAYLEFTRDCELGVTDHCPAALLEIIWVQVNAVDHDVNALDGGALDRFNHARAMNREVRAREGTWGVLNITEVTRGCSGALFRPK